MNNLQNLKEQARGWAGKTLIFLVAAPFAVGFLFAGVQAMSGDSVRSSLEIAYKASVEGLAQSDKSLESVKANNQKDLETLCNTWAALAAYKDLKKESHGDKPARCF